jgi:cell division transport system permease protein
MMNPFRRSERALGVAREKRRYDLPLNRSPGTRFLVLLIGLMTFLALMALGASFVLGAMTQRWTSGLENRVTVEIPAQDADGNVIGPEEMAKMTDRASGILENYPAIAAVHVMERSEIAALVSPWLGDAKLPGEVPLPALISVEIKEGNSSALPVLEEKLKDAVPLARLDRHEDWLKDLLRFTRALQFAAALLTAVIGLTTVTAVAGAVRSRIAVYHAEVELLHLMGANDPYIARQFQRHSLALALKGSVAGGIAGALAMLAVGYASGRLGVNLVPEFRLSHDQLMILCLVPVATALIAGFTARQTVMKVLAAMP